MLTAVLPYAIFLFYFLNVDSESFTSTLNPQSIYFGISYPLGTQKIRMDAKKCFVNIHSSASQVLLIFIGLLFYSKVVEFTATSRKESSHLGQSRKHVISPWGQ